MNAIILVYSITLNSKVRSRKPSNSLINTRYNYPVHFIFGIKVSISITYKILSEAFLLSIPKKLSML